MRREDQINHEPLIPRTSPDQTAELVARIESTHKQGDEMASVDVVKEKVQRLSTERLGPIPIEDGEFVLDYESVRIFISVRPVLEDSTIVRILCVTNWTVPASPELFKHVATRAYGMLYGALSVDDLNDGNVNVVLAHTLLGDALDPEELYKALAALASVGNEVDDEIKKLFGGNISGDLR